MTGTAGALGASDAGNLVIRANGADYTVALANNDNLSALISKINAVTGAGGANLVTASDDGSGNLKLDAVTADVDFSINASSTDATTTALGLTEGANHNSTSLLDTIGASGTTLTIAVNGGASQQITFGTGGGQVSTLAELNTAIGTLSGVTGSASNSSFALNVASSSSQNSIAVTSSAAGLTTALGIGGIVGTTNGTAYASSPDATRTSLQSDFNNILGQIDSLAKDASYNGVNLLDGDDLKVVFNETGSSSQTISGVTFDTAGLGLVVGHRYGLPVRYLDRRRDREARHRTLEPAHAGLEVRFEPDHGADPSGLHQEHDHDPADRCRQPRVGRHQRGRRQPPRPADPSAALHHGPVALRAGRPGGVASVLIQRRIVRNRKRRGPPRRFFFGVDFARN